MAVALTVMSSSVKGPAGDRSQVTISGGVLSMLSESLTGVPLVNGSTGVTITDTTSKCT